jgi:hypothetical protein
MSASLVIAQKDPDPEPVIMYSVVILNFHRPQNIKLIIDDLITFKKIQKVIISNGNRKTAIEYKHPKVLIFNDWDIDKVHGLDLRFLRMLDCPTKHNIIMDDDIIIDETNLNKILIEYEKDNQRVVGVFGRNVDEKNIKYTIKNVYEDVSIVLTKLLVCNQNLVYLFFYCKPLIEDIYKKGIPYGNGEDIFFSFIVSLYYGKLNYTLRDITTTDVGNDQVAVGRLKSHSQYRDMLCKFLYSNKFLFKNHIDKFIFPRYYNKTTLNNQILKKTQITIDSQNSKNLILTFSLGKDRNLLEITEKYMKNYAEKCEADFIVLHDDSLIIIKYNKVFDSIHLTCGRKYGGNSYYLKVSMIYHFLGKYEKVLWLDDSCIVSPKTENLFNIVKNGSVGGFNEGSNENLKSWKYDSKTIKTLKEFEINTTNYLNSGIVLYTKPIQHLFSLDSILANNELFTSTYPHQCYLNFMLQSNKIPIVCFDSKYNNMFLHYDYSERPTKEKIYIHPSYILLESESSIFHMTGWWGNYRYQVLKNIANIIDSAYL